MDVGAYKVGKANVTFETKHYQWIEPPFNKEKATFNTCYIIIVMNGRL
jgi:hypothetical protein